MAIIFEIPVEGTENLSPLKLATKPNWVPPLCGEPRNSFGVASNHVRYFRQPDDLLRADHRRLTLQRPIQQGSPVFA
jgi:hypothetical protein